MTGRSPKVVVIGGTYVDMAVRCSQIPSPGQSVVGSALSYSVTVTYDGIYNDLFTFGTGHGFWYFVGISYVDYSYSWWRLRWWCSLPLLTWC